MLLVAMPFVTSSFLLLVAMPGVPLVASFLLSNAICPAKPEVGQVEGRGLGRTDAEARNAQIRGADALRRVALCRLGTQSLIRFRLFQSLSWHTVFAQESCTLLLASLKTARCTSWPDGSLDAQSVRWFLEMHSLALRQIWPLKG